MKSPRGSRGRRSAVMLLAMLVALSTFVSAVAVWSHGVLLNTDSWVATVGPLARNPKVTDAVAGYLVDQAVVAVDLERVTKEALPAKAGVLAAPMAEAVRTFLTAQTAELMQSERFHRLWINANRAAHTQAVRILRGEPGALTATDGSVTLNLVPAVSLLLQKIETLGFIPDSFEAPAVDWKAPASESIAALEASLDRDLPPDFGQVTVMKSHSVRQAQDAVKVFEKVVWLMVALTVTLLVLCLVLSTNRRRTVVVLGIGISAALILTGAVVGATSDYVLGLITNEVDRSAAAEVVKRIISSLQQIKQLIALAGLAIAAIAYLTGDSAPARRFRGLFRRGEAETAPSPAVEVPSTGNADRDALVRNRDSLQLLGVIAALAVVVIIEPTFATLAVVVAAALIYQLAIAIAARTPRPA